MGPAAGPRCAHLAPKVQANTLYKPPRAHRHLHTCAQTAQHRTYVHTHTPTPPRASHAHALLLVSAGPRLAQMVSGLFFSVYTGWGDGTLVRRAGLPCTHTGHGCAGLSVLGTQQARRKCCDCCVLGCVSQTLGPQPWSVSCFLLWKQGLRRFKQAKTRSPAWAWI